IIRSGEEYAGNFQCASPRTAQRGGGHGTAVGLRRLGHYLFRHWYCAAEHAATADECDPLSVCRGGDAADCAVARPCIAHVGAMAQLDGGGRLHGVSGHEPDGFCAEAGHWLGPDGHGGHHNADVAGAVGALGRGARAGHQLGRAGPGGGGGAAAGAGGAMGLVVALWFEPLSALGQVTAKSWAAWVYLLVFGTLVALNAYLWLLQNTSAALAGSYSFVNPAVALLVGVALGGELLTGWVFAALPLIGAALAFILYGQALQRWLEKLSPGLQRLLQSRSSRALP